MTARGIMVVLQGRIVYNTNTNFCKVDVDVPKYKRVDEVADAPSEIVQIRNKHFLYRSGAMQITVTEY